MVKQDVITRWWFQIKNKRKESGQTLVELALVLPFLVLLIFGAIEFGRILNTQLVINSAAREGARTAIVNDSNTEAAINNALSSVGGTLVYDVKAKSTSPTVYPDAGNIYWFEEKPGVDLAGHVGQPVEIYIKGRVDIVVPFIGLITGNPRPISAKAVMMIER